MCGIISYFSNEQTYNKRIVALLTDLLWIDSVRGDHSTGLIYQTEGGVDWYKKAIPGWDFVQLQSVQSLLDKSSKMKYLIGHNRAATRGDVNSNNAHPFQFSHITGVHNGTLQQYAGLVKDNHNVDSQYLYDALSTEGWQSLVPRLQGSFNLLWHDNRDNTIHMCKNETRPYAFAKLKNSDILIGASEKPMLKWLVGKHGFEIEYCWTPKDNVEYIWKVDSDMVKPSTVMHKGYVAPVKIIPHKRDITPPVNTMKGYLGKKKTENIEFFFDKSLSSYQARGTSQKTVTLHGQTVAGESVRVYGVLEGEYELDTWYQSVACWLEPNGKLPGSWLIVDQQSIRLHPLEQPHDALLSCINCGEVFAESEVLFVDDAPACLACCQQLNVQASQVNAIDAERLFQ